MEDVRKKVEVRDTEGKGKGQRAKVKSSKGKDTRLLIGTLSSPGVSSYVAVYNPRMAAFRRSTGVVVCLIGLVVLAGCRSREVEKDLIITDVRTGWYDVGIVDGMNKLVPSITLKLKNISSEPICPRADQRRVPAGR